MKKALIIGIIIVILAIATFAVLKPGNTGKAINTQPETSASQSIKGDLIKIPLSQISTKAKWYEYNSGGKNIRYFAVKTKDGSIKTAFNACDVCYGSKKGYRQDGEDMICNNCGNHYAISGLGTKNTRGGGCWPGYLPSKTDRENLIIKKSDLEVGGYRF